MFFNLLISEWYEDIVKYLILLLLNMRFKKFFYSDLNLKIM